MTITEYPEYLSEKQAAVFLGISLSTLRRLRKAGNGPEYIRFSPKIIQYTPEALTAYLSNMTVRPKFPPPAKAA